MFLLDLGPHLEASRKIPDLKEILLIGFFSADSLRDFLAKKQQSFSHVPIRYALRKHGRAEPLHRYLNEGQALGTAGGLFKFRKEVIATTFAAPGSRSCRFSRATRRRLL